MENDNVPDTVSLFKTLEDASSEDLHKWYSALETQTVYTNDDEEGEELFDHNIYYNYSFENLSKNNNKTVIIRNGHANNGYTRSIDRGTIKE